MATKIAQHSTMQQSDIRRVPFVMPNLNQVTESIAADAAELLGYKALKNFTTPEPLKPLAQVLSDLGIEILNNDDVKKYQFEKITEVAQRTFAEWLATPIASYRSTYYSPGWRTTGISEYEEPVPEFVLNKALQIKRACPDVVIEVQWLEEHPDPFLIVKIKGIPEGRSYKDTLEEYIVEVWEENTFENRAR